MWYILLFLIATTMTSFPTDSTPSTTTTTEFVEYDSALGYSCHSNTNCGGLVGNSVCLNGICACQPGYIPQGIMRCIPK